MKKLCSHIGKICLSVAILALLASCHEVKVPANSVYYWQSQVDISPQENAFLKEQKVTAVYLHLYDITLDGNNQPVVVNKVRFRNHFPKGLDIIPVVFISPRVINDSTDLETLAAMVVNGVSDMLESHGYREPSELQVDYDWNADTQSKYFEFLEITGKLMRKREGGQLSVAVRLHQLDMTPPPADYAVFMLYNTLSTTAPKSLNDVLTYSSIKDNINRLKTYEMPLATSLPVYGLDFVYSGNKYRCMARGLDLQDTTYFRRQADNTYLCTRYQAIQLVQNPENIEGRLYPGDIIYHRQSSASLLDSIASLISRVRPGDRGNIVVYRLDNQCVKDYSTRFFKDIFAGGSHIRTDSIDILY